MISFRFHVVSITAVFLAIAIGVVVGSTYVDRAVVENLERRIDTVSSNLDERKQENDALESRLADAQSYVTASADFAVTGRLTDVPVLLLAARGIDEAVVEQIALLVRRGGGVVPGVVWLETRWALPTDEDQAALAGMIGANERETVASLQRQAWSAVVEELLPPEVGPDAPEGEVPVATSEVLAELQRETFVSVDAFGDSSLPLVDLAGSSPRVLVLTGSGAVQELDRVMATVIAAPVSAGLATVVADVYEQDAEARPVRGADLIALLSDEVRDRVVAVDHADLPEGRVAAVLGLAVVDDGIVGHFGYGDDADGVLPGWTPP